MNFWEKYLIKFRLDLRFRVKMIWWIIRYRGKKNIPPECIEKHMEDSMREIRKKLEQVINELPDDVAVEEKQQLRELARRAKDGETKS